MNRDADSFFPAAAISAFLQARCPRPVLSMLSEEPHPSSTTSSLHFKYVFFENPISLYKRKYHIALLSSRLLLRSQLLGPRSQVHFQRFLTHCKNNSVLAASLKHRFQTLAGRDCVFPSFPPSMIERQVLLRCFSISSKSSPSISLFSD